MQNNPLKFIDPTGIPLNITGEYADELVRDIELQTEYKLIRDKQTGAVTIDTSVKRNKKGTSKNLANLLKTIINDSENLTLKTELPAPDAPHAFIDVGRGGAGGGFLNRIEKTYFMDDHRAANAKDPRLTAIVLGHVLQEGYLFMAQMLHDQYPGGEPHDLAMQFESKVLSDFTGQKEQTRVQQSLPGGIRMVYTSISYDIYHKQFAPQITNTVILVNDKNCRCKK